MGRALARVTAADRREALLDAAVELVEGGDVPAVSMETVAERAGVSRPLVYKHFANRDELLAAVYQREVAHLHRQLAREVAAAPSVEEMFRTLLRGSIRGTAERGPVFASLRAAGARNRDLRKEQRSRDGATVRAFATRASAELGIEPRAARASASLLLSMIDDALAQWRRRPSDQHAAFIEEVYVGVVRGALAELARAGAATSRPAARRP